MKNSLKILTILLHELYNQNKIPRELLKLQQQPQKYSKFYMLSPQEKGEEKWKTSFDNEIFHNNQGKKNINIRQRMSKKKWGCLVKVQTEWECSCKVIVIDSYCALCFSHTHILWISLSLCAMNLLLSEWKNVFLF